MAREGMVNLIRRLRGLTQVGTAQYTVGTVTWWSDAHLIEVLDAFRVDLNMSMLQATADTGSGGTVQYFTYYAQKGDLEEATSGTTVWRVMDGLGSVIGTANYSVEYVPGIIRFNSDTLGTPYYLWGRAFNLAGAAAQIWREMASNTAAMYSFESDNQRFNRSDWFKHCMELASAFDQQGGVSNNLRTVRMVRTDLTQRGGDWS